MWSMLDNRETRKALQKIYEVPIFKKLGLSITFPHDIIYVSKTLMGLGVLKFSSIIEQLQLKMYIGHARLRNETQNALLFLYKTL